MTNQVLVVRTDLGMTPGKIAAQYVCVVFDNVYSFMHVTDAGRTNVTLA